MGRPVIALLTDFGTEDFFVASLRAVILNIQPEARVVDISHSVRSFDIRQGSYVLAACYKFFPASTIFVAVVDPGVGTKRRILLAKTEKYAFVAPDNGVLSDVLRDEKPGILIDVKKERFFLKGGGHTFDGRDKMAPVAAWLSLGLAPEEFGPRRLTYLKLPALKPKYTKDRVAGHIVYIDKFGNCLTNIPLARVIELKKKAGARNITLRVRGKTAAWSQTYHAGREGQLVFLPGSQATVEIAIKEGSAAADIGARIGDPVVIYS